MTCVFAHPEVGAICGHQRHHVVGLFHGIDMKGTSSVIPFDESQSPASLPSKWPFISAPLMCLANIYIF